MGRGGNRVRYSPIPVPERFNQLNRAVVGEAVAEAEDAGEVVEEGRIIV